MYLYSGLVYGKGLAEDSFSGLGSRNLNVGLWLRRGRYGGGCESSRSFNQLELLF